MKAWFVLSAGLLLVQPAIAGQDPITQFTQSACNTPELTDPAKSGITTREQLEKKLRRCDIDKNINWYEDEIQAIVDHIAKKHYSGFTK